MLVFCKLCCHGRLPGLSEAGTGGKPHLHAGKRRGEVALQMAPALSCELLNFCLQYGAFMCGITIAEITVTLNMLAHTVQRVLHGGQFSLRVQRPLAKGVECLGHTVHLLDGFRPCFLEERREHGMDFVLQGSKSGIEHDLQINPPIIPDQCLQLREDLFLVVFLGQQGDLTISGLV
jgi:hypothetical protein